MNGKYFWLKLKKDFFKRHDIRIIESMPNGKEIALLYLKMLAESLDHQGRLRFNDEIPYTPEMLAAVFLTNIDIIKSALKILTEFEMLKVDSDGTYVLTKFEDFVGCETQAAVQKRNQRNLPTLKNGSKRLNGSAVITPDGKTHNVDEKRYGGNGMLALDRALGKCELCGSDNGVVVHHNNGYSTDLDDLVCLCTSCHGKAHNSQNNGHINIERPPYVGQVSTECPPNVCKKSAQNIDIRDKSIEIRDKSLDIKEKSIKEKVESRFIPPTVEEVSAYCFERNNGIDAEKFVSFYEAKGWYIGKNKMKDWKAAVRTWESKQKENPKPITNALPSGSIFDKYTEGGIFEV